MDKKFTIEEFKKYCQSQDSMGDILYFLTEENVEKANVIKDEKSFVCGSIFQILPTVTIGLGAAETRIPQ